MWLPHPQGGVYLLHAHHHLIHLPRLEHRNPQVLHEHITGAVLWVEEEEEGEEDEEKEEEEDKKEEEEQEEKEEDEDKKE